MASIPPYQYFAKEIVKDSFEVITLIPPGVNAHTYEPLPQAMKGLQEVAVWFQSGDLFEKKIATVLEQNNPGISLLDMRKTVPLIPFNEDTQFLHCEKNHCPLDELDPHVWLSPKLAIQEVKAMEVLLEKKFPEHRETFKKNTAVLIQKLKRLQEKIQEILPPNEQRIVLASHPAFGYFCNEFNCLQLAIEFEGKDPLPKEWNRLYKKIEGEKIAVALLLPQFNNKGAELIAKRFRIPAVMIDPLSPKYEEMLLQLAKAIAS